MSHRIVRLPTDQLWRKYGSNKLFTPSEVLAPQLEELLDVYDDPKAPMTFQVTLTPDMNGINTVICFGWLEDDITSKDEDDLTLVVTADDFDDGVGDEEPPEHTDYDDEDDLDDEYYPDDEDDSPNDGAEYFLKDFDDD